MGTLNYYLQERPNRTGKYRTRDERTVLLVYQNRGGKFKQSTKLRVPVSAWDAKKQRVRPSYTGAFEMNALLEARQGEINRIVALLRLDGGEPSAEKVKEMFLGEPGSQAQEADQTLEAALAGFIDAHRATRSENYRRTYTALGNDLAAFALKSGKTFTFGDTGPKFFQDFESFLVSERKQLDGTVSRRLGFLRTFLNWCVETGLTDWAGFRSAKVPPRRKARHTALTEEELAAIAALDLAASPKLAAMRDVFLVGCYTGLRYSDLKDSVRPENVVEGPGGGKTLRLWIKKTKDAILVPLPGPAVEIIDRHGQKLPAPADSAANKLIKEIARLAGITGPVQQVNFRGGERLEETKPKHEMVTTHTARRTFATLSKKRGMDVVAIQRILGHHGIAQTLEYIKETDDFQASEMKKAWG